MINSLYMMPTNKCNSACSYCYIPHKMAEQVENNAIFYDWLDKFIHHIKEEENQNNSPEIRIIGGEPYLKPKLIKDIAHQFLSSFKTSTVIINTNGTLLTKEFLTTIPKKQRKRIIHVVSIDGTENIHNARRKLKNRKNAFRETINGIKLLQQFGMPFSINMVLDEFSVSHLDSFMNYLTKEMQVFEMGVSLLYQPGQKSKPKEEFKLLKRAYDLAEKHGILLSGHHRLKLGHRINLLQCKAGQKSVLITPQGKMFACQRFVGRTEGIENITELSRVPFDKFHEQVNKTCYCHEQETLGDLLYKLYEDYYPSYLKVTKLDKRFFGVI